MRSITVMDGLYAEEMNATDYVYTYDYDVRLPEDQFPGPVLARYVILGIALTLGVLASLMLMPWPVFIRRYSPFFVVLTSWSTANLFYLAVTSTVDFSYHNYTWVDGEFWCRGAHYLAKALSFTRGYLMVLAALFTLLGNYRFNQCVGPKSWFRVAAPVFASTLVWIMIFLPCIQYYFQPEYRRVGVVRVGFWCLRISSFAAQIMELILLYLLPALLTAGALLCWAFRKPKPKMADRKEKVQAIVILIILQVYVLANLFDRFVDLFLSDRPSLNIGGINDMRLVALVCKWADHVLSPTLSLVAILVYRRQLTSSEEEQANNEAEDT